jgi:hypothetical protein
MQVWLIYDSLISRDMFCSRHLYCIQVPYQAFSPREKHISDTFPHHHGWYVKPHLTLQIIKIRWVGGWWWSSSSARASLKQTTCTVYKGKLCFFSCSRCSNLGFCGKTTTTTTKVYTKSMMCRYFSFQRYVSSSHDREPPAETDISWFWILHVVEI